MVTRAKQAKKPDAGEAKVNPAKEKKASSSSSTATTTTTKSKSAIHHPPYLQMVMEAISFLKERTGSSQYAIAKYLQEKYSSGLPAAFKRILSIQLKLMSKNGKITQVKHSFKLPPRKVVKSPSETTGAAAPAEPKAAAAPKKVSPTKDGAGKAKNVKVAAAPAKKVKKSSSGSGVQGTNKAKPAAKARKSPVKKKSVLRKSGMKKSPGLKASSRAVRSSTRSKTAAAAAAVPSEKKRKVASPKKAMPAVKRARRAAAAK